MSVGGLCHVMVDCFWFLCLYLYTSYLVAYYLLMCVDSIVYPVNLFRCYHHLSVCLYVPVCITCRQDLCYFKSVNIIIIELITFLMMAVSRGLTLYLMVCKNAEFLFLSYRTRSNYPNGQKKLLIQSFGVE